MSDRKTEKRRFHEFDHERWDRSILKKTETNDPKSKSRKKNFLGGGGRGDYAVSPQRVLRTSLAKKKKQKLISAEKGESRRD